MAACTPELIPIKGKYNDSASEITLIQQADSVWLNLTALLTRHGLLVKKIDKVKGLLTSKESAFIAVYTFEDDNGQLIQPQAWVVLNKAIVKGKQWYPKAINSQWNIQVNETKEGTLIKIDPVVMCTYYPNMFTRMEDRGKSTGKLEELIKSSFNRP